MDQVPSAGAPMPQKSGSVLKVVIIVILVLVALGILGMVALGFVVKRFVTGGGVENFIENQIEKETGKDVDLDLDARDGTLNIESEDGSVQISGADGGAVKVPAVISAVAPVMPGAVAKSAVSVNETADQKAASWAFFTSSASAADIKAYYIKEMTAKGWVKSGEVEQSGLSMVAFAKGEEQFVVNIGVVPGTNSTDAGFQLILTEK